MSIQQAMADRPDLQWDASLSVGNALLDRQHILLFQLTRSFSLALQQEEEVFRAAFAGILELAQRHCAAEEQLLLGNGYEWVAQHREEHIAGLDRLQALGAEVACGTLAREQLAAALRHWMVAHLVDMDLPASEWLAPAPGRIGDPDGHDPLDAS